MLFEPNCLADSDGPFADVEPALSQLRNMGIEIGSPDSDVSEPTQTMFITGSKDGLNEAKQRGLIPILLASDPDEAMKLTALKPAGVVVSLLELPDFIRLLRARITVRK